MQAIILAGGFGTRLRSMLPDVPKPMAPVNHKPFLAYLLHYLKSQGISHVILSVHHLHEKIESYFQTLYQDQGLPVDIVREEEALGTGGAIVHVLRQKNISQPVFVLNGDTFVTLDYQAMFAQHQQKDALLTMALTHMQDVSRYGKVMMDDTNTIVKWKEKGEQGEGLVNAGVYLIHPRLFFSSRVLPQVFSFEKDFLMPMLADIKPQGFMAKNYFIDIGVPDDYIRAKKELPLVVPMPDMPVISIIMPVLNGEKTIEKAIRSVLDQQYKNVELIIMDGGSTDKTVDIIRRYENHIAFWQSQKDGGPCVAVNAGIKKATGEYIALLMSDDWYEPGTLEKTGQAALLHPGADILTCGGRIVSEDEKTGGYVIRQLFDNEKALFLSFYNICFAASAICCRFIRKSLYDRIGLYLLDHEGKHIYSNDKEFLLRALVLGAKDIFLNHLGHNYLSHPGSTTFSHNRKMDMRLCQEHMYFAELYLARRDLRQSQRLWLRYWYLDQSARTVLYHLLQGEIGKAIAVAKTGIRKYPVVWPVISIYTAARILVKRLWTRGLRKMMGIRAPQSFIK